MLPPAVECDLDEAAAILLGPQADENCKAAAVSLLRASAENFAEWLGETVGSDFETLPTRLTCQYVYSLRSRLFPRRCTARAPVVFEPG
jgi:hypothetical protein